MGRNLQETVMTFPLDTKYRLVFLGEKFEENSIRNKSSLRCLNCTAGLVLAKESVYATALRHLSEKWGVIAKLEDLDLTITIDTFFGEDHQRRSYVFLAKHWQYVDKAKKQMNEDCWLRMGFLSEVSFPNHSWFLEVPRCSLKVEILYDANGSQLQGFVLRQF